MKKTPLTDKDGEVRELMDEDFDRMRPMKDTLPELTAKMVEAQKKGTLLAKPIGRPKSDNHKIVTTVRFDSEIINFFKRDGKGWQTRMNDVLAKYVASH